MGTNSRTNELYHYGRKGMKWGQRIFSDPDKVNLAKNTLSATSKTAKDVKKELDSNPIKKKKMKLDLKNMSDKELQAAVNRANLERQYNELFAPEIESKSAKAQKVLSATLGVAGTVAAIGAAAVPIALEIYKMKNKISD